MVAPPVDLNQRIVVELAHPKPYQREIAQQHYSAVTRYSSSRNEYNAPHSGGVDFHIVGKAGQTRCQRVDNLRT